MRGGDDGRGLGAAGGQRGEVQAGRRQRVHHHVAVLLRGQERGMGSVLVNSVGEKIIASVLVASCKSVIIFFACN